MLTHVDHITLVVPDLTVALDFFTGLGFTRRLSARGTVEVTPPGQDPVIVRLREDTTLDRFVIDHSPSTPGDQAAPGRHVGQSAQPRAENTVTPTDGAAVHTFIDPYGTRWELSAGQRD